MTDLAAAPRVSRCPITGRTAAPATGGLPRLPSRWPRPLPDLGAVAAMLGAPDRLFRDGAALAASTGAGAFRARIGFDEWVVVVDDTWTAAFARLGPADADPFEFRLRMPSLRVPGVQPPADVEGSARVSREALARRCAPDAVAAQTDALAEAARRRLALELPTDGVVPDAFGLLLRCCVDMTSAALLGPEAPLPATLADDYRTIERALTPQDLFLPRVLSPRALAAEPARRRVARAFTGLVDAVERGADVGLARELLDGAARRGAPAGEVAWTLNSVHWAAHRYPAVHAMWLGVELQQRPELLARLQAEQRAAGSIDATPLLRGCVLEGLRLHPLMALPRRLRRDVTIAGHTLAAGQVIALSPYLAHSDTDRVADADRFHPDRWLGDGPPRGAFVPGGVGRWGCVGMRLTVHMLTVLWSTILRSGAWELLDPVPAYRHGPIITPPARDLRARFA